ncbi:MAG: hypothetical protein WDA25_07655 [Paracoccaceae bacterium]
MSRDLRDLARLSRMILDAELEKLRRASEAVTAKTDAIAALHQEKQGQISDSADPAMIAGAGARWLEWMKGREAQLAQERAVAAATREARLHAARRAFGRDQVLSQLAAKAARNKPRP